MAEPLTTFSVPAIWPVQVLGASVPGAVDTANTMCCTAESYLPPLRIPSGANVAMLDQPIVQSTSTAGTFTQLPVAVLNLSMPGRGAGTKCLLVQIRRTRLSRDLLYK